MLSKKEMEMLIKTLKRINKNNYSGEIKRFSKGLLGYLNEFYFTNFS